MGGAMIDEQVTDTVYPWFDVAPSPKVQTGGDWYRLFLTASLRGKAIHGANTAPTCEVLCKTTMPHYGDGNFGLLKWDDTLKAPGVLGRDISDQFYVHPPFRGNITASGSILAYESGLWEPSMRKRARSSSLLAAGLVVHGMTDIQACDVVRRLTGEPIDIQAVHSAILPASHLKREMVIVSKASHRVFSRGTIQTGLTWYDERLVANTAAQNMAFDWGRITTMARYIGEANIQNCPMFTYHAKTRGIPFTVVRNSWAYVSEADYRISPAIFNNVVDLDLAKYKIPSLVGSFIGHEQDIMMALNRSTKYVANIPESEAFRGYVKMYRDARERRGRKKRPTIPDTSEARDFQVTEHSLTEEQLTGLLEGGTIVRDSFLTAIASLRKADKNLDDLLTRVASVEMSRCDDFSDVDQATKVIYDKMTWIIARVIAESTLKERDQSCVSDRSHLLDKITARLCDMKESILGYKSHIEVAFHASTSQIVSLRPRTIMNAQKSSAGCPHVTYSQRSLASNQLRLTSVALSNIDTSNDELLLRLKDAPATTVRNWYHSIASHPDEPVRVHMAYFAYIYTFLNDLTSSLCYQKESGYIEGTQPRRSFVYQAMVLTASDYNFIPPRLQRLTYHDAQQLARELDTTKQIPYSVSDSVDRTLRYADIIVGDLMIGKVWCPPQEMYFDELQRYQEPISPGYDVSMMTQAENETYLAALMEECDEMMRLDFAVNYEACLNSYPSQNLADSIARSQGYPNLRAAFDMLGEEVFYTETSQYVTEGLAKITLDRARAERDDGASTSKRKYDSII